MVGRSSFLREVVCTRFLGVLGKVLRGVLPLVDSDVLVSGFHPSIQRTMSSNKLVLLLRTLDDKYR